MKKWILLVGLSLGLVSIAQGAIVNVPADYGTIQTALDSAAQGDTVLVAPGTYVENIDFHGKQLVLASWFLTTRDTAYISQTVIDGNRDSSTVSIESVSQPGTILAGFSITNGLGTGDWPRVRGGGIHIKVAAPEIRHCYIYGNESVGNSNRGAGIYASSSNIVISNCRIFNNTSTSGSGITIGNGATGTRVDSCRISNNDGGEAILIAYSSQVTISRSYIVGNLHRGIRSFASNEALLINTTIADNAEEGLLVSGNLNGTDSTRIVNSIIYGNTPSYYMQNDTLVVATYSLIEDADTTVFFGAGCLDTIPMFAENYQLQEMSPAIDAGDPASDPDPDGTVSDMGAAYYFQDLTGIGGERNGLALTPQLFANYPNPFNPATTIAFELPQNSRVQLQIFNILGELVNTLVNGNRAAGSHSVRWDGTNLSGEQVSSGIYLYRLKTGERVQTRKMMLVK